jgi:small subunit ribosomal protein S13
MARLQFHDQMRVQDLSEPQLNALSALLSAPGAAPRPSTPLQPFSLSPSAATPTSLLSRDPPPVAADPLPNLVLEEDLRRQRRADIAHHRTIGTLRGRQHAMQLPVRGQRNKTNARTAKRLNRIERRVYGTTSAAAEASERVSRAGCVLPFPCSAFPEGLLTLFHSSQLDIVLPIPHS